MANTILINYIGKGLRGKSPTTIKTYQHALVQFENWLKGAGTDLEGFARADVQQYDDRLAAHKKQTSSRALVSVGLLYFKTVRPFQYIE